MLWAAENVEALLTGRQLGYSVESRMRGNEGAIEGLW